MTTLEFVAVLYVALCVGATVAYVIATMDALAVLAGVSVVMGILLFFFG